MPTSKKTTPVDPLKKETTRLYRTEKDKVLGGVCGGLGVFFNVDSTLIRLIFVLLFIFGGSGFLLYIILWIVIPTESSVNELTEESIRKNVDEIRDKAKNFTGNLKKETNKDSSRNLFAYIVVVLGIILLLSNFGYFQWFNFGKLWPLFLIMIGIVMLARRDRE